MTTSRSTMDGLARRARGALALVLPMWLAAGVCGAKSSDRVIKGVIADEADDALKERVAKLSEAPTDGTFGGEGALILLNEFLIETSADKHQVVHNRIVRVTGTGGEEVSTETLNVSRDVTIVASKGWILRVDGTVERLGDTDIRVVEPQKKNQPVSVIIAFPRLGTGDVLGWSLATQADEGMFFRRVVVSDRFPVRLARLCFKADGKVAYRFVSRNMLKDKFSSKVLAEQNEVPSEVELQFRDVPARHDEPYAAPVSLSEPVALILYRGFWSPDLKRWIYNDSWNTVGVEADDLLRKYAKPEGPVRDIARRLTAGMVDELARADALYRFVRDEVLEVSGDEMDDKLHTAARVLEDRAGNSWEKVFLLSSLLQSVELDHRVLWAQDRNQGKFDEGYPALWTFSDMLVDFSKAGDHFYVPTCVDCTAGELPAGLRGGRAFAFVNGASAQHDQVTRDAFYRDAPIETIFGLYKEGVRTARWHEFLNLPGDPLAVLGTVEEMTQVDAATGAVQLSLKASGFNEVRDLARVEPDPTACTKRYVERRFTGRTVLTATRDEPAPGSREGDVSMHAHLEGVPPPPAAGGSWVVPPETVYGTPTLGEWTGPDRGPFHVGETHRIRCVTVLPLPAGWSGIAPVHPTVVECPTFRYEAAVTGRDGMVIVERSLTLRASTVDFDRLEALDYTIQRIHEFERAPLLLQDAGGGQAAAGH